LYAGSTSLTLAVGFGPQVFLNLVEGFPSTAYGSLYSYVPGRPVDDTSCVANGLKANAAALIAASPNVRNVVIVLLSFICLFLLSVLWLYSAPCRKAEQSNYCACKCENT